MVANRHYIAKNVDFSISLLIKVWWSNKNLSAFDDTIIIAAIALESIIIIEQSRNPRETGENYPPAIVWNVRSKLKFRNGVKRTTLPCAVVFIINELISLPSHGTRLSITCNALCCMRWPKRAKIAEIISIPSYYFRPHFISTSSILPGGP